MSSSSDPVDAASVLAEYRNNNKLPTAQPPLDHLVLGVISDATKSPEQAAEVVKALRERFVNWNECRVARRAEIARLLDPLPDSDAVALRLRDMLNRLFDTGGNMNMDFLSECSLTDARRALLEVDGDMPRAIVSLLLFQLCPGATLPLSPEALKVARKKGLISRTGSKAQLQKKLLAEMSPMEAGELVQYFELDAGGKALHKPVAKRTSKKAARSRAKAAKARAAKATAKKAAGKPAKKTTKKATKKTSTKSKSTSGATRSKSSKK